jgi:hypothetical protein
MSFMLFLGAGASKAVGIGDLKDLTDEIMVRLKKEGYEDLIQDITETLEKANRDNRFFNQGEIDIEVIFSVLNGLSNPTKALKEIGPYAIYVNELGRNQESPLSEHLRNNEEEMKRIRTLVGEGITSLCSKFNLSLNIIVNCSNLRRRCLGQIVDVCFLPQQQLTMI